MCGNGEGEEINCKQLHRLDKSTGRTHTVIINVAQPKAVATDWENRTTSCLDFCRLADKLTKNQEGVRRG